MCHIANCGDDNTLYPTGDCFEVVIEKLSADLISFISWFHESYVVLIQQMLLYSRTEKSVLDFNLQGTAIKKLLARNF